MKNKNLIELEAELKGIEVFNPKKLSPLKRILGGKRVTYQDYKFLFWEFSSRRIDKQTLDNKAHRLSMAFYASGIKIGDSQIFFYEYLYSKENYEGIFSRHKEIEEIVFMDGKYLCARLNFEDENEFRRKVEEYAEKRNSIPFYCRRD